MVPVILPRLAVVENSEVAVKAVDEPVVNVARPAWLILKSDAPVEDATLSGLVPLLPCTVKE